MTKKEPVGGIYKILIGEMHFYVGRAKDFKTRWQKHMYAFKHGKGNRWMLNLYRKLGPEAFVFTILETLPYDQQEEREQYYIDLWWEDEHCCNASRTSAGGKPDQNLGGHLSEEHKAKISAAHKGSKHSAEHSEKVAATKRGVPTTDEHKKKCSDALKGRVSNRKGMKCTEEQKQRISESRLGKKRGPYKI